MVGAQTPVIEELAQQLIQSLRGMDLREGSKAASEAALRRYQDFAVGYRHDVPGAPTTTGYLHGPGGLLSWPGVDQTAFSTVVGNRGLFGQLPTTPSLDMNPTYAVITGVTADSGAEKNLVCDDAPVAGIIKSCYQTSVFGRYERATAEIELNRLGQRVDRADPMDITLVGTPLSGGPFGSGPGDPAQPNDVLTNELSARLWERAVSLHRLLSVQAWTGNPANNSAGGGYKELTGLDMLITTGHVDALTGVACPSVDSDVKDFNYQNIEDNGSAIVEALTYLYYTRRDLAERTGLMPVRWVFAMKPETFYALTAIWPCAYLTYRCNLAGVTGGQVIISGDEQTRMRDELRNGRYLLIDGNRIEVIVDDGIAEDTSTTDANVPEGCFASSIYLIPMSVVGGRAVTYLEYFQYSNPAIQDALSGNLILGRIEGPWLTIPKQTTWCIQFQSKIEPRLLLRTPWLAGRLDHVLVCPLQRTRSPFPESPYFSNGGNSTSLPGPSYYTLWGG